MYEFGESPGLDALLQLYPDLREIFDLSVNYTLWRKRYCLNMSADENVLSPLAILTYLGNSIDMYMGDKSKERSYWGLKYLGVLEEKVHRLMGDFLETSYVDLRPINDIVANVSVLKAFTKPGDMVVVAPLQAGIGFSRNKYSILEALSVGKIELPLNIEDWNIDVDKAIKLIEEVKPRIIMLGSSLYLFPHPNKELAEIAHTIGAKVLHDVAHVLGLIIGGVWENPLKLRADVITASTHRTFPGPQGGLIAVVNERDYEEVSNVIPLFTPSYYLHRLIAIGITAVEMKIWGRDYAVQVVKNAKTLAEALASEGFKVVLEHVGYTSSHQVAVDVSQLGRSTKCATLLREANIIVDKSILPRDKPEEARDPSGLRICTQEVTRWGMRRDEMEEIARFMKMVLIDRKDPAEVRQKVIEFRKEFIQEVHYGFKITREDEIKLLKIMLHAEV